MSRIRQNRAELGRVAREDRIAASQMKRLADLQDGLLESWDLLPEECKPLLDEDIFTIVGEVEGAARLARRRAALRRHLESVDRRSISGRIEELERDLAGLEQGSPVRATFESALEGRRGELAGYGDVLGGISMINAQLESAESLLGNLRGELLALDDSLVSGPQDPGLARLRERIAYFRHGLDERGSQHVAAELLLQGVRGEHRGRGDLYLRLGGDRYAGDRRVGRSGGARIHRRAGRRGHQEPPA